MHGKLAASRKSQPAASPLILREHSNTSIAASSGSSAIFLNFGQGLFYSEHLAATICVGFAQKLAQNLPPNSHTVRDDIKNSGEIPYLYIVKIEVLTPSPRLSLQPNFPFSMGKGKFACKDRQFYPLPRISLQCKDREFPRKFDVVP